MPVLKQHLVAANRDDTFDEACAIAGRVKNHNITTLNRVTAGKCKGKAKKAGGIGTPFVYETKK